MSTNYALFDPHSAYNALRATLLPHEKIRGYFHWQKTRRSRGEEQPGPSPERPPLVLRGGSPPVPLQARVKIPDTDSLPGRYRIDVVLLEQLGLPEGNVPCRAFLVEQGVLDRLRAQGLRITLAEKDDLALVQLLDHRLLSEEFEVQQAVAALPELEGQVQGNRILLEADIPPGSPNISDRAWVVVVIDGHVPQADGIEALP
jgi:hypothetical protein